DELGSSLESRECAGRPLAAVTFDDGYEDFYRNAFPLLKEMGIPAAVFVVTGLIGTSAPQIHDRLYLLLVRAFSYWRSPERRLRSLLRDVGIRLLGLRAKRSEDPLAATVELLAWLSRSEVLELVERLELEFELPEEDLAPLRPLNWEMLRELERAGMTIG